MVHWVLGVLLLVPIPIGLIFILYALLDQRTKVFTLTTRTVMAETGILSRKTMEVGVRDIRNINMTQGIVERMFGLGSVQIASSGTAGIEVEFKGIKNPAQVRDQIRHAKDDIEA